MSTVDNEKTGLGRASSRQGRNSGHVEIQPTGIADVSRSLQMGRWLPWSLLAILGVAFMIYGGFSSQGKQTDLSKTSFVISDVQVGIQAFGTEAILAAKGNPGSIENLKSWRTKVNNSLMLLSRGGKASSEDKGEVISLSGDSASSLKKIKEGFQVLDAKVSSLEEIGGALRDSAVAEGNLELAIVNINKSLNAMERNPEFRTGSSLSQELAPIKGVLLRPEMQSLRVIFSPIPGAEALQSSWARQFNTTAAQMKSLNDKVASSGANGASKMLVSDLYAAVALLSNSAEVLKNAQSSRLAAQQMQLPIQTALSDLQKPLADLGYQMTAMQSQTPWAYYLFGIGLVLGVAGILALIRSAMTLGQDHWAITQENKASHGVSMQNERLARSLRRILNNDQTGPSRLEEDSSSPIYGLVSQINILLDSRNSTHESHQKLLDSCGLLIGDLSSRSNSIVSSSERGGEAANKNSQLAMAVARELAEMSHIGVNSDAENLLDMVFKTEVLMNDGQLKMDKLREQIQNTSKKLKRLAESAQSIVNSISLIDEVSRNINILAMKAAIEAAAHGESGRRFAVISKDIERLSLNTKNISEDMRRVVSDIQSDTQETVTAMELSTSEVVSSADLGARASSSMVNMEGYASQLKEVLDKLVKTIEKQAVASSRLSTYCDDSVSSLKDVRENSQRISTSSEKIKTILKEHKRDLPSK